MSGAQSRERAEEQLGPIAARWLSCIWSYEPLNLMPVCAQGDSTWVNSVIVVLIIPTSMMRIESPLISQAYF